MISRRSFLVASGMTALASTRVFGANDKIRVGVIGAGGRMRGLLDAADNAGPRYEKVRTYWWQNDHRSRPPKAIDQSALDWKAWMGGAPDQPFSEEKFYHWRWFWNFGGGAMTDLFTHWIDVVHWAMKSDQPSTAFMLGDKYIFEQWDCPDTVQADLRHPVVDVVY